MTKPRPDFAPERQQLARFVRDRRGNVAMLFGLTMLPFAFLMGAAVDYSRASDSQARLQRATDAVGLQLCQMPNNLTKTQYYEAAKNTLLPTYLGTQKFDIKEFNVTENPHRIKLVTTAVYDTAVVRIMGDGFKTMNLEADAQCENQEETFEIALVLDTTGSMAASSGSQSKMEALKTAATNFVEFVYKTPRLAKSKISIVPFAAAVKLDPVKYRNEVWIDRNGKADYHWNVLYGGAAEAGKLSGYVKNRLDAMTYLKGKVPSWDWAGCFESLPYPFNVQDGMPDIAVPNSFYVPMFSPDESGDAGQNTHQIPGNVTVKTSNSYIDDEDVPHCKSGNDEAERTGNACKYVYAKNATIAGGRGPNHSCTTRALTRLTADKAVLLNEISQLQPAGNTNVHEGTIWGWRTLAPSGRSVFGDGAAYDKSFNHKILIVLTDGMNTWSANPQNPTLKSGYSAYGFYRNPDLTGPNNRLPAAHANVATDAQARAAMDALTKEACKNAGATGTAKPNVVIYTIGFSVPNDPIDQQGIDMLKDCAGASERAFVANDSQSIIDAFQKVAHAIAGLKLTQ